MTKSVAEICNCVVIFCLGVVKKCGLLKIVHDKYKQVGRTVDPMITEFFNTFEDAKAANKEVENLLSKTQVIHRAFL